jgi:jumonji domain-containing protein 7
MSEENLDPIATLLTTYNELNGPSIDILPAEPSALEFMRYVCLNRPFVVRGAAQEWRATQTWNTQTLKAALEGASVNVAVTPFGYVHHVLLG